MDVNGGHDEYLDSDDSEGPVLREFVNQAEVRPLQETVTSHSPRVSRSSTGAHHRRSSNNTSNRVHSERVNMSERHRREREAHYANKSPQALLALLIEKEYESKKLSKELRHIRADLQKETRRANDAEALVLKATDHWAELTRRYGEIFQDSTKAQEQLSMYKRQFDLAQKEIERAQGILHAVEAERDQAYESAAHSRSVARHLDQDRKVYEAREEGRNLGFESGFRAAQEEFRLRGNDFPASTPFNNGPPLLSQLQHPPVTSRDYVSTAATDSRPASRPQYTDDNISDLSVLRPPAAAPLNIPHRPNSQAAVSAIPPIQSRPLSRQHTKEETKPEQAPLLVPPPPARSATSLPMERFVVEVPEAERISNEYQPLLSAGLAPAPWPAQGPVSRPQMREPSPNNFMPAPAADGRTHIPPPSNSFNSAPLHNTSGISPSNTKRLDKGKAKATESWYLQQQDQNGSRSNVTGELIDPYADPEPVSWYNSNAPHRKPSMATSATSTQQKHHRQPSIESTMSTFSYTKPQKPPQYPAGSGIFFPPQELPPVSSNPKKLSTLGRVFSFKKTLGKITENPLSRQGSLLHNSGPSNRPDLRLLNSGIGASVPTQQSERRAGIGATTQQEERRSGVYGQGSFTHSTRSNLHVVNDVNTVYSNGTRTSRARTMSSRVPPPAVDESIRNSHRRASSTNSPQISFSVKPPSGSPRESGFADPRANSNTQERYLDGSQQSSRRGSPSMYSHDASTFNNMPRSNRDTQFSKVSSNQGVSNAGSNHGYQQGPPSGYYPSPVSHTPTRSPSPSPRVSHSPLPSHSPQPSYSPLPSRSPLPSQSPLPSHSPLPAQATLPGMSMSNNSRISVKSHRTAYSHFDPTEYVDPAYMATPDNRLRPLPGMSASPTFSDHAPLPIPPPSRPISRTSRR